MSEIKLNEWRWGVVPKLHHEAVVMIGGMADRPQDCPQHCKRKCVNDEMERWYAILSLGPPVMPEPELRLPEGWTIGMDLYDATRNWFVIEVRSEPMYSHETGSYWPEIHRIRGKTRRECVEEINRILGGAK